MTNHNSGFSGVFGEESVIRGQPKTGHWTGCPYFYGLLFQSSFKRDCFLFFSSSFSLSSPFIFTHPTSSTYHLSTPTIYYPAMATPQELVPHTESIAEVYATDDASATAVNPEHQKRFNGLVTQFSKSYGHRPDFVARSPGRVNIIGEHIDYNLYDVLPTAVSVDVIIAVKVVSNAGSESTVKIANVNPEKFPSREFTVPRDTDIEIDPKKHEWVNYFKAGLSGALKFLRREKSSFTPASVEVLVDGNVPPGGGISSSAAFVCASALAVMKSNNHDVSKQDLLDLAVVSERAVGVYSGGYVLISYLCLLHG